jgi:hypothetical protein
MSKIDDYRKQLRALKDWTAYLLRESGLPGPRGNLELARAFAEEAGDDEIEEYLRIPLKDAPENTAKVFLVFCGVSAFGMRLESDQKASFIRLKAFAGDPRWRVREAVAIALQYFGDRDIQGLLREMKTWAAGSWYEKRAAVAALAEPRLLRQPGVAAAVLRLLDRITRDLSGWRQPKDDAFRTLRQTMGYGWSVAVSALPTVGRPMIEKWLDSDNADVRWVMTTNLKKSRLEKLDARWVKACLRRLGA